MTNSVSMQDKQRKLSAYQKEARKNPTKAESLVLEALLSTGLKFVFQKGFLRDNTIRLVDFYFPGKDMTCLEVDGKYHDGQKDYDDYRESRIKGQRKRQLRFVRVTNEWVFEQKNLASSLKKILGR